MKKGLINNRIKMNNILKKNSSNKNCLRRNYSSSSQRYLNMYEKEKEKTIKKNNRIPNGNESTNKINLTDIGAPKTNKKIPKNQINKKEKLTSIKHKENSNLILSNSFDISQSNFNIQEYMNFLSNHPIKNPFIDNISNQVKDEINNNEIIKKIIYKYTYKNKKWYLVEENNNKIYWEEYFMENEKDNKEINDLNSFEEKYISLKYEYNKLNKLYNEIKTKFDYLKNSSKSYDIQIKNYLIQIKNLEDKKEEYINKNKKLKKEINKIPYLIEQAMIKFKEEAGKKISKKIYDLEQENKLLKQGMIK